MTSWRVIEGDCRDVMASMDEASVHTVVTSPPYYGLRDYGLPPADWPAVTYALPGGEVAVPAMSACLGLEPTVEAFVGHLVLVFRGAQRVLRDDGTAWLNLGDSYAQYDGQGNRDERRPPGMHGTFKVAPSLSAVAASRGAGRHSLPPGFKRKDLLGVPWLVAFALRADGWYLRSEVIWAKPSPMPESVTDRPTKAHEQVFLLAKRPRYYYDAAAIREPDKGLDHPRTVLDGQPSLEPSNGLLPAHKGLPTTDGRNGAGANKRSVWTIATQPYPGAHFAVFPAALIEPCILAGCPERCCAECGAPWVRQVERTPMIVTPAPKRAEWQAADQHARTQVGGTMTQPPTVRTLGFAPSCDHDAGTVPGTVLDPFAGAGTTIMQALRLGRSAIGVELSPVYAAQARERIVADCPLHNQAAEAAA